MIQIKNSQFRISLALAFLFLSLGLTFFSVFYAEVFRTKPLQKNEIVFPLPFRDYKISQVDKITIQNKNGIIDIQKENNEWRSVDQIVDNDSIKKVLESFFNLRIRNLHKPTKDNISNFSIDKPYATLEFQIQNKNIKVELGLLNSVDNSQYLLFSHLDYIYQVDQLKFNFESFSPSTQKDNLVFNFNIDEISSFKIYNEKKTIVFDLYLENNQLNSKTYPRFTSIDLRSKLINILQIKNTQILSKKGNHVDVLNNYIKFPLYHLEFVVNNQALQYLITSPIIEIQNLNLSKDSHFLIVNPKNEWHLIEASALSMLQF
jgi:hypothetical protein